MKLSSRYAPGLEAMVMSSCREDAQDQMSSIREEEASKYSEEVRRGSDEFLIPTSIEKAF